MSTPDARRVSRFIDVDGTKLHALDWGGDGPPLLLVHGGRRTGRSWNAVARRLHDAFRVIALDIRGHGDSEPSEWGNDSTGRARDIARVAEGLELPPHFVMAHSLGTLAAAPYAASHPDRVRGLLLIEPIPDGFLHWVRMGTFTEDGTPREGRERRNGWASMDDLRERLLRNRETSKWTPEVLEDVLREETRTLPDGSVEIKWDPSVYNLAEMRQDTFSLVKIAPHLTMPTLILAVATSPLLESHYKPVATSLPKGKLEVLTGYGHAVYMEDPELVAKWARGWFLGEGKVSLRA
jgi:pimeloyl-ACP methyl ester carboxylesterase